MDEVQPGASVPSVPFGGFPRSASGDSVAVRIARYDAYSKRCSFFAAGLGGLVLLVGQGTLLDGAPELAPWIATIAIAGVVSSALAFIPFVMARDALQARLELKKFANADPKGPNPAARKANEVDAFPRAARVFYWVALSMLILGGMLFILGVWIP
jgi:hypothetical protein